MRAILGIGNKGNRYKNTRHNIGFLILDNFALKHKLVFKASTGSYYIAEGKLNSNDFILIKPATYINNSGIAAAELFDVYDLNLNDLLVVQDDLNLEFGSLRIRASGGDGGHNGVSSIIYHLNTNQFPRLRFGIGNSFDNGNMADFVLSQLSDSETEILSRSTQLTNNLLEEFIIGGLKNMFNLYSKAFNSDSQNNLLNQSGD